MQKKILLIGSGAREHAIAWKLVQSSQLDTLYVCPGNPGTQMLDKCQNISADYLQDFTSLAQWCLETSIDFVVVGPEKPLADGIADILHEYNILVLGPYQEAAQLESSKAFCKAFLGQYSIPTAGWQEFDNFDLAKDYLKQQNFPQVIKADGLAAGKGVVIVENFSDGEKTLQEIMIEKKFSSAGNKVVIEEFLHGIEASYIVMVSGGKFVSFVPVQDYKRALDGDKGENTGGMGCYAPSHLFDDKLEKMVIDTIVQPCLDGLNDRSIDYCGFLFFGLMIDSNNLQKPLQVLEINCRMGDPETQLIMLLMKSDLLDIFNKAVRRKLENEKIAFEDSTGVGVVLAAQGYPEAPLLGTEIPNVIIHPLANNQEIFHAGTKYDQHNKLVTSGGRVATLCAKAGDIVTARQSAYALVEKITWPNAHFRKDIASF